MSITHDEVVSLLQIACTYDSRNISAISVTAWKDAANRAGWTFAEAEDVIRDHYARSTAYLLPGAVTEMIRERREASRSRRPVRAVLGTPAGPPASAEHRSRTRAELALRLGWNIGDDSA